MPETQSFDDDDFPVLTDVVKPGDAALIETARETYNDTQPDSETAPHDSPPPAPTPAEISRSITAPPPPSIAAPPFAARAAASLPLSESQLEQLIDEIIERHTEQMRNELHTILKHRL